MSTKPDIYWDGESGQKYGYWIHKIGTTFKTDPGNYIFVKEVKQGQWSPVYIGQTSNLNERLVGHNEEQCALKNGATHIHAHTSSDIITERKTEETDLIQKWKPTCNDHHIK